MKICNCYISMVGVMSFSKDKHEKFFRCPRCRTETKPIPIKDSDLGFGEVLLRETRNTK